MHEIVLFHAWIHSNYCTLTMGCQGWYGEQTASKCYIQAAEKGGKKGSPAINVSPELLQSLSGRIWFSFLSCHLNSASKQFYRHTGSYEMMCNVTQNRLGYKKRDQTGLAESLPPLPHLEVIAECADSTRAAVGIVLIMQMLAIILTII